MKNYLQILEITANYRNLHLKTFDLSKNTTGHLTLKGAVGEGKTNFIEFLKLITHEGQLIRNKEINPDGKQKAIGEVKFSDNFYLGMSKSITGEINFSLYAKDTDGKKITPMKDGKKLNPKLYREQLTTELTYGINEFLSDNPTVQWEFIKKAFREQLMTFDLLEMQRSLDNAIKNRDFIQIEQSKIGAFHKHLIEDYGDVCPPYIDPVIIDAEIEALKLQLTEIKDSINKLNSDAFKKHYEDQKKNAENINAQISAIRSDVDKYNANLIAEYNNKLLLLRTEIDEHNAGLREDIESFDLLTKHIDEIITAYNHIREYVSDETDDAFVKIYGDLQKEALPYNRKSELRDYNVEAAKLTPPVSASIEIPSPDYPSHIQSAVTRYGQLIEQQKLINNTPPPEEVKYDFLNENTTDMQNGTYRDEQIRYVNCCISLRDKLAEKETAADNNAIVRKFQVYEEHKQADNVVQQIRNEIKQAFEGIDTGVTGLKLVYNDEKRTITFYYTGECFGKNKTEQPSRMLSDFSHTEKRYIAVMLQLALLKKKENPLNAIFLDELGMDAKTQKLFSDFATEHGLLILTTQTGDFDKEHLSDNEILVENGHLFFGEHAINFTDEEIRKFINSANESDAPAPEAEAKPKGKGKRKAVDTNVTADEKTTPDIGTMFN